jgi:hypothetical protein
VEAFVAHAGPKLSYGKQALAGEFFVKSHGLLFEQGFEDVPIQVKPWCATSCFFAVDQKSNLPFDIFSAAFFLMSRYEEYLPHMQDAQGRFPATASLGYREGFLHQPVVDIWANYFMEELIKVFPNLERPDRDLLIHNLVDASVPFAFAQRGWFRSAVGYVHDIFRLRLVSVFNRLRVNLHLIADPFDTFDYILEPLRNSRSKLTVFFLLGEAERFKDSYNSRRKRFQRLVKYVADYTRVGLVFSLESLQQPEKMTDEKRRLEELVLRELQYSNLPDYRVILPDGYRQLVELEVERDFSMTYPDVVGFRAGTCTPFLFYDLDYEITSPLEIHPIAATTVALQRLKRQEIFDRVEQLLGEVRSVGGTFSLVFRNRDFVPAFRNRVWNTLYLEKLQQEDERQD